MAAAQKVDYARIEPDWRAGIKSAKQLAADYASVTGVSVSHVAILKHFKAKGIPRNLNAKIQAAAEAKVTEAMVTDKVAKASEPVIIEANATAVATIRLTQRSDIGKARALSMKLMAELEAQTDCPDLLEELVDVIDKGDGASAQAIALFNRVTGLSGKTKTLKELADTMKTLVALEREAYGVDKIPDAPPPEEDFDPVDSARRIAFILAKGDHEMRERETLQ